MGKKTFGTVTNARYPKGCFFLNNKVYFNPGKTGKGHGAASPVCVAKAGATKKPAKKLVLAANGKPTCAGKGAAVKNENACKAAAKAMKKKFASSGAYASYPKGCFLLNNQFYYNKGKTGKGNSKARAACVGKAAATKKPSKKLVMAANGKPTCAGKGAAVKCMYVKGKAICGKCPKGYTNSGKKQCKKATATKKPTKKLVLAGKGKANCAGKGAAVKGQNGCKAAAKSMKKTFGIVTNARYPKGCFSLNNKVYFNPGKTGRAHGAASPVCVSGATVTKKPSKKLFLAASGKANCAGKGVAVKNENGCKAAAKAMKKDFTGSRGYPTYPKGCFVLSNKFYYNNAKTGKGNSKARPVCVTK